MKGIAYLFNRRCGQIAYNVSGPILDNSERVLLQGNAPRVGANCQILGYFADTLEFKLVNSPDAAAPVEGSLPPEFIGVWLDATAENKICKVADWDRRRHISEPGLEVGEIFRRVAADVLVDTAGVQHPEFLVQNSRLLYFTMPSVTECDKTASDEQNFLGSKGVPFDDVDPLRAIPACEAAVNAQPDSARLNHNLARAYEKNERLSEALSRYRIAAEAGYPPAINALGIMYLAGCGLPQREPETGIKAIARARDLW